MEHLEKLIKEFTENYNKDEITVESLNEFLMKKKVENLSNLEKNYILKSSELMAIKSNVTYSYTEAVNNVSEQLIGENKLSGRLLKQYKKEIQEIFHSLYDTIGHLDEDKVEIQTGPYPLYIDLHPINLNYKVHKEVSEFISNEAPELTSRLSKIEKSSLIISVTSQINKWISKRLSFLKEDIEELITDNIPTNLEDRIKQKVLRSNFKFIGNTVKYIFIKHMYEDLTESELESILSEALKKVNPRLNADIMDFIELHDLEGQVNKEEVTNKILAEYQKRAFSELIKFYKDKGTTIKEIRKEIFEKRSYSPEKTNPKKFTSAYEFEKALKDEANKNPGLALDKENLNKTSVLQIMISLSVFKSKGSDTIKRLTEDLRILPISASSEIITTKDGLYVFKLVTANVNHRNSSVVYIYIDSDTNELRAFIPTKGNVLDENNFILGEREGKNLREERKRTSEYVEKNYKEQIDKVLKNYDREGLIEFLTDNLYIFNYNEEICLKEFENSYK